MKERPILFSGAMVRALLDGSKTQTRRVAKVRNELPPAWATFASEGHSAMNDGTARPSGLFYWSEEQTPGDPLKSLRRWPVLPAKHPMAGDWYWTPCPYGKPGDRLWVRETWGPSPLSNDDRVGTIKYHADNVSADSYTTWKPSIHMPRWASRITLEVTGVRVERVQQITDADAFAEGCPADATWPLEWYRDLWDSLKPAAGEAWADNPWVWVVEFKRVEK